MKLPSTMKSFLWAFVGLLVLTALLVHLLTSNAVPPERVPQEAHPTVCVEEDFATALRSHAAPNHFIILALVDSAFADMAVNLYLTSFKPHGITNFLFVGAGKLACDFLRKHSLPCFTYTED